MAASEGRGERKSNEMEETAWAMNWDTDVAVFSSIRCTLLLVRCTLLLDRVLTRLSSFSIVCKGDALIDDTSLIIISTVTLTKKNCTTANKGETRNGILVRRILRPTTDAKCEVLL